MLIRDHSQGFQHRLSSEITPQSVYQQRRALLQAMAGGAAGAVLAGWAARNAMAATERPGKLAALVGVPSKVAGAVSMERTTFAPPPARFEAGTPPIVQAVGLGAAVDYLSAIGMPAIAEHEHELVGYALAALSTVDGLRIFGPTVPDGRGGTISFELAGIHPHDVGQVLDSLGVQVRVGHHCARPTCVRFGVPAMTRASFYLYTTPQEIDALVDGLEQVRRVFA